MCMCSAGELLSVLKSQKHIKVLDCPGLVYGLLLTNYCTNEVNTFKEEHAELTLQHTVQTDYCTSLQCVFAADSRSSSVQPSNVTLLVFKQKNGYTISILKCFHCKNIFTNHFSPKKNWRVKLCCFLYTVPAHSNSNPISQSWGIKSCRYRSIASG